MKATVAESPSWPLPAPDRSLTLWTRPNLQDGEKETPIRTENGNSLFWWQAGTFAGQTPCPPPRFPHLMHGKNESLAYVRVHLEFAKQSMNGKRNERDARIGSSLEIAHGPPTNGRRTGGGEGGRCRRHLHRCGGFNSSRAAGMRRNGIHLQREPELHSLYLLNGKLPLASSTINGEGGGLRVS